jgi:hypothetical protein
LAVLLMVTVACWLFNPLGKVYVLAVVVTVELPGADQV